MDRKLVLTNEGARHWLRQIMPPERIEIRFSREPMSDAKLFWLTFIAGFMAFYGFLA